MIAAVLVAGATALAGCSDDAPSNDEPFADVPTGTTPSAESESAAPSDTVVSYDFDRGLDDAVPDLRGRLPLRVVTAADGALTTEPHDDGLAVRFPRPCPAVDQGCPRAILESGPADMLNPGPAPVRFGAAVRLSSIETGKGENVVQKGFSTGGASQFKLQIDGTAGRPSCVLVGTGSPEPYPLRADTSIADGAWHVVTCTRTGTTLTIVIDGREAGRRAVPVDLSISNAEPLRIGGKGVGVDNDQFHGAIDDVTVAVG